MRLGVVVDATERLEMAWVEALDSNGQPVDAGAAEVAEFPHFERARIRLERHFAIGGERKTRADIGKQPVDRSRRKKTRRAASEKHAVDLATPYQRQGKLEVSDERVAVFGLGNFPFRLVRIEVAVGTFAHAPGNMHVQGERRQHLERWSDRRRLDYGLAHRPSRSRASSRRSALPRWLTRFFRAG